ncbi:MAG: hypothetical protein A2X86_02960 [Bdellovibrionales bacterium GWA2_49_15]|nr:MAG: hypothetical protein A2X86_02960 [Bdellovibrionales bacterium GWA2_49_15]HAZ14100.1 molybdopterin oxidoreductase [Bdellovibrionales bacterium]
MKKYWRSIEELEVMAQGPTSTEAEFSDEGITDEEAKNQLSLTRRGLIKMGFNLAAVSMLSGCETPVHKAITYLVKPDGIVPGNANYYASTFFDGNEYCSILVKTREGRPIKIEGNELSTLTGGGTSAKVQASVLSLYDDFRLKTPLKAKAKTTWDSIDSEIVSGLSEISKKGEKIVILTSTIISPTTRSVLEDFAKKFPTTEIIAYDAISASAIIEANKLTSGKEYLPSYSFAKADLIVSFGADFLGTWISPTEFTKQYSGRRKITKNNTNMVKHVQFESTLTLTGSNADFRIPINPSEEGIILLNLYNALAGKIGKPQVSAPDSQIIVSSLAEELWAKRGHALVVSGSNDLGNQIVVNKINEIIGSYGATIDNDTPVYVKQAIDGRMDNLVDRLERGEVKAILLYNVNPAYDYPRADKFINGLGKVKLSVSFSETLDETAALVTYVCPDNHFLESWNDAEPKKNHFSLCQPTINRLFDTRQAQESLLKWSSDPAIKKDAAKDAVKENPYYLYLQKYWQEKIFPLQSNSLSFHSFWTDVLQKGVFVAQDKTSLKGNSWAAKFGEADFAQVASAIVTTKVEGFEFTVFENIGIGNGKHANNPWLQELPDPVSKVCWDNYLAIPDSFAKRYHLKLGDNVIVNDLFELPVLIQPGQASNTLSIALGYGRTSAGKVAESVGKNSYKLVTLGKTKNYSGSNLKISPTGVNYIFALTQTHHTMEGRNHVHHAALHEYKKNPAAGNEAHFENVKKEISLYKTREFNGHHWGLTIDLNLCTGCSNCVIACQAENNIPVVGRDEVRNKRIMHWMRVDRYYSEQIDRPEVFFQPVMCQHCNNAPCENVCPVEATQNSHEGLNEMAYNRCIGTRYCMNNCPYRVRRFNWFEYSKNPKFDFNMNSDLGTMVLNPDVVVRTRGVVEKCSLCAQRIQEGKLRAKLENRPLADGDIQPACLQSCPASAMIFGDLNNPNSQISVAFKDERKYSLLEELNTANAVGYMTKIKIVEKDYV